MPAFLKQGKFIVYIMIFVFVLFFTLDFGAVDLQKVAIVVTLGLDYESEEQNYVLSGQIAVTDSISAFTAAENQAVIYGSGKTPSMALKNMEDQSGWHPYISFCKLIIVSKSVFAQNIMDALDFFLRNEQLNDTALICATEEKAADILNSKTSLDEVSTFSLLKTLMYNGSENMNVVATNLKDFAVRYYNSSNGNILTYIKMSESVEADGEGEEEAEEESGDTKIFNPTMAAVFRKSEFIGLLSSDEVRAYNLVTKKVKRGQMDLQDIETRDYFIENCSVEITNGKFNKSIYFEGNNIVCDINVHINFKIDHLESEEKNLNFLLHSEDVPKEFFTALKNRVKTDIQSMIDVVKSYDADIFDIEETLFKFRPGQYRKYKEHNEEDFSFIKNTKFNITINVNAIS
ncbi:MAG: Ger(x)C family spore germination C-terminal domain-containing protein [Firmicutes bacterium]|nr:Ger(x)C family spore germination C-terminal domain-containing protein [Bacillota bacterium]